MSLLINGGLILGWGLSLALALGTTIAQAPWWILLALVLVRTQLHTGLFIVAHDAMHRLLLPAHRRGNDALGAVLLMLYAGLAFGPCSRQHQRHHTHTARAGDPDVPANLRGGPLAWYRRFLARYLSLPQMLRLLGIWSALVLITMAAVSVSPAGAAGRVLLFVTLPLLLSSLQLFLFGTYLPHRRQRPPERLAHPSSLDLPPWLSLLACFHFSYHREHHDHPALSWHQLPSARGLGRPPVASGAAVSSS